MPLSSTTAPCREKNHPNELTPLVGLDVQILGVSLEGGFSDAA
jgi:hypothetical protein